jgi:hypothetical protein
MRTTIKTQFKANVVPCGAQKIRQLFGTRLKTAGFAQNNHDRPRSLGAGFMRAQRLCARMLIAYCLSACASPQYRAIQAMADAPLNPLPRYDALGSTQPLTPSVEQWALYEETSTEGRALLTVVLLDSSEGWVVELNRRPAVGSQRVLAPLNTGDDPFLHMRRGAKATHLKEVVELPAGRFVGVVQYQRALYHPRVPVLGLISGRHPKGTRWKLLRFGLNQPPNMR